MRTATLQAAVHETDIVTVTERFRGCRNGLWKTVFLRRLSSLSEHSARTSFHSRKVGGSSSCRTVQNSTEPHGHQWLHGLALSWPSFEPSDLPRPRIVQKRFVRSCRESRKFLRPSAFRLCLQHAYNLPRKSKVWHLNPSHKLFHVEQRDLEPVARLLTLKDADKLSK